MSLYQTQAFLSRYVRDQDFRQRYRDGQATDLADQLGLSTQERGLIAQIQLDQFDRIAEHVLTERLGRTSGVFDLLLEHLGRFVDVDECYRDFDRQWSSGWWQRRTEIRRFEAYLLELVVAERLPEYLIDLARFCAQVTVVAEAPKVAPGRGSDLPGRDRVLGNDLVTVRGPAEVLHLRHDVLRIIDDPDGYGTTPTPLATAVLIQRDWRQHKRSRIFRLSEEPVLGALVDRPATVLELGERLPTLPYATLLTAVAELYGEQIVHLTATPELVGDFTSTTGS